MFFVHILSLATEARSLNLFHHIANPLVTAMFVDRFPLSEIRDWDSYRNGEGMDYPNEFRAMEQFCRDRLPGVRRLADRQKTRAALDPPPQHKQNSNPQQGRRDFYRDKGNGRAFEHDRKGSFIRLPARRRVCLLQVNQPALLKKRLSVEN